MTTPPRTTEALLAGLGADGRYRDALLGDLAEEFALRVESEGVAGARSWYRREALRAAPHLLRSTWRRTGAREVGRFLGVALTSFTCLLIVGGIVAGVLGAAIRALGIDPGNFVSFALGHPSMLAAALVLGLLEATLGGYFAAWLDERGPLATAIALGLVWAIAEAAGMMFMHQFAVWYRVGVPIVIVVGTALGGVLRVHGAGRQQASIANDG